MQDAQRGQSGLDRLLVFVITAVVIVAVLPTVLGFAGIDVRPPGTETPEPTRATPTPEPASLQVLNVSGETGGPENETIGVVRVTVTKVGSSASVDAADVTATWARDDVSTLVAAVTDRGATDGTFGVEISRISNSSGLVLAETGDRATLTFDLGDDDVPDVAEFGTVLAPNESVDVVLATGAGETTTVSIEVPDSLEGKSVVGL
jgi:archaellin